MAFHSDEIPIDSVFSLNGLLPMHGAMGWSAVCNCGISKSVLPKAPHILRIL